MTDVLNDVEAHPGSPSAALRAHLDDPQTAASLTLLLDNLPALALMAQSVTGLLERGDTITDSLADGLKEVRGLSGGAAFLVEPSKKLATQAPAIADAASALLDSGMLQRDVVEQLGALAQAMLVGIDNAKRQQTQMDGIRPVVKALRDPDVARGLGLMVEVARAVGRTL